MAELSPERRQQIHERIEKATAGPWHTYRPRSCWYVRIADGIYVSQPHYGANAIEGNADFIAHARQDVPDLLSALEQVEKERARVCAWRQDDDGVWHTECKQAHQFTVDGPTANNAAFCCYCGGHLVEFGYVEPEDDEAGS